jgi:SAM-dependent methyltransferase
MPPGISAFDIIAEAYDGAFTHTRIGSLMRAAVQRRMDLRFRTGHRILEMNCGTGEDAIYLAKRGVEVFATDASPEMVRLTSAKIAREQLSPRLKVSRLGWEELNTLPGGAFDGALSNFGGLNCISDLPSTAKALAGRLRPGAIALLCIMGPFCPWEWVWFTLHGQFLRAFRRLNKDVRWRSMLIQYPSIATTRRAFSPIFRVSRVSAIGALVPPPFAETLAVRHQSITEALYRWERALETLPPLPFLADHYLLELERQ